MPSKDDRVVCIDDDWNAARVNLPVGTKFPKKNDVYYIAGLKELFCDSCWTNHPFYFLVGFGWEVCYDAKRFRPVIDDEQRTESTVRELLRDLKPTEIKTPEKVS